MEFKQKKRSEIEKKYTWNLEKIFPNHELLDEAFSDVKRKIESIKKFENHILDSKESLSDFLSELEDLGINIERIGTYVSNRFNENNGDPTYQEYYAKLQELFTKFQTETSFIQVEILKSDREVVEKYMEEDPSLKIFDKYFEDIFRYKPHTLSKEEEKLLSELSPITRTGHEVFSMLTVADMKFPNVTVNGEEIALTNGNFVPLMGRANREDRKEIFKKFYNVYGSYKNTLAKTLDANVKSHSINARLRNFDSARECALFENAVPVSVYDNLIETISNNLGELHDYMGIRKKALGVDELHLYDIYTPLVGDMDLSFTFDESKDIILEALKPLGDDYIKVLKDGFENRWCDVYETEGKRGGAYSSGSYSTDPYILLNYHDTLENMFTVAHEMGHSMHTYHSNKFQPYFYANYSIFVAEVASTVNESLLTYYLLDTWKDEKSRKYLLNHFLERLRGTLFRQTQFAEFERDIYSHYEKGGALTAEFLNKHYLELNKKYYGPNIVSDDEIMYEWARIPHFYYNFYVYQYATGISCALSFAKRILEGGEKERDMYLGYLKSGSSDTPIEVLRRAGVEMDSKKPIEDAIELFKEFKNEFKSLM